MIASRAAAALVLAPGTRIALFDLQRQRARLDAELRARMDAVLAHGQFILGPEVELLDFARYQRRHGLPSIAPVQASKPAMWSSCLLSPLRRPPA